MIYQLTDGYYVRPLAEDDINGPYPTWFEDQEVCRYNSHGKLFKNKAYFKDYLSELHRDDRMVWAICHVDDGHIGNASLQNISQINRTAEFAIILGDKRHWGKGLGHLVLRQLFEHGFHKLNLDRIYCGLAAPNEGMKRLAVSLGMTLEGNRRQHLFIEGRRVDMLEYGILRAEFDGNLG